MKAKTVKEVLVAGRWILENVGWCQLSFYQTKSKEKRFDVQNASTHGDVGCACAVGSIYLVDVKDESLHEQAVRVLQDLLGDNSVAAWNDNPYRTKKEVVDLFTKGIKKVK